MDTKSKIFKLSRFLKTASLAIVFALPLFTAGWWITNGYTFMGDFASCLQPFPSMKGMKPVAELSAFLKLCGFFTTMIPTAFNMLTFFFLARLFKLYETFEFFSFRCVRCIRNLGITILTCQIVYPFYFALLSLALTISNPPGERMIAVSLGSEQIYLMIVAGAIILASWIMDEGRKLQEEQESVI